MIKHVLHPGNGARRGLSNPRFEAKVKFCRTLWTVQPAGQIRSFLNQP
jgi:hypothetical protein